jgi:hypothetical protein
MFLHTETREVLLNLTLPSPSIPTDYFDLLGRRSKVNALSSSLGLQLLLDITEFGRFMASLLLLLLLLG